jgi:hypothetical protein
LRVFAARTIGANIGGGILTLAMPVVGVVVAATVTSLARRVSDLSE